MNYYVVSPPSLQLFKKQLVQWTSPNTSVTCDTFVTISVLFICLYSCMSYYYLLSLVVFIFRITVSAIYLAL